MAIRLVKGDFWEDIHAHEKLIRKCFIHLYNKFPSPDGQESMYAALLIWMYEKEILKKFDPNRGRDSKSIDKKWEHFIFCYLQKFMEASYYKRGLHRKRYKTDKNIDLYHRKSYSMLHKPSVELFNNEIDRSFREKNKAKRKPPRISRANSAGAYPSIDNLEDLNSSDRYDATDHMLVGELNHIIESTLVSDTERRVVQGCKQGLTHVDIAAQINKTPAAVSAIVKRIRKRCLKKKILSVRKYRSKGKYREKVLA